MTTPDETDPGYYILLWNTRTQEWETDWDMELHPTREAVDASAAVANNRHRADDDPPWAYPFRLVHAEHADEARTLAVEVIEHATKLVLDPGPINEETMSLLTRITAVLGAVAAP